jgi:fructose 1,6-bisphosphate aldolase/phosphatase
MKTTLNVIKPEIGSFGGHLESSECLICRVRESFNDNQGGLVNDLYIGHTGDDIAVLFSHQQGVGSDKIHKLDWDAFLAGTEIAKEQGLYGAGQDLLKDAFSGNVKGMGLAVAEMEFQERPNEAFLFFCTDKTDPGAHNPPLYLGFADPMYNSGSKYE